jgi:hypothetical protein
LNDDASDRTYSVKAEDNLNAEYILNYIKSPIITMDVNKLLFSNNSSKVQLTPSTFSQTNFINSIGTSPIPINYEFIVGYDINIFNIKPTEIPVTTVCALCYKNDLGDYNYADFSIREVIENGQTLYLSDCMYYNEGTLNKEVFGLCRHISTTGNITTQCGVRSVYEKTANPITTPGKMNIGDSLKNIVTSLGKLTFCTPHAHGLSDVNGINIINAGNKLGIPFDTGHDKYGSDYRDEVRGSVPTLVMHDNPKYNLVLNTKDTVDYNTEFISTNDWNLVKGRIPIYDHDGNENTDKVDEREMREFVGLTGSELAEFNKKLIETCKNIYVYNPDYSTQIVYQGDVNITDNKPIFTSNLISSNSKLTLDKSFNEYVYFGTILVSNYLDRLNKYSINELGDAITIKDSANKPLKTVEFEPDFTYCGTNNEYYLVSSLSYNATVPKDIVDSLTVSSESDLIIKHSDGTISFGKGNIDKKAFYGFSTDLNKLVQLDVSNYTINNDGKLILNPLPPKSIVKHFVHDLTYEPIMNDYNFTQYFDDNQLELSLSMVPEIYDGSIISQSDKSIIIAVQRSGENTGGVSFDPLFNIIKGNYQQNHQYYIKNYGIELQCAARLLNNSVVNIHDRDFNKLTLSEQSHEFLSNLIHDNALDVSDKFENNFETIITSDLWSTYESDKHVIHYTDNQITEVVVNQNDPINVSTPIRLSLHVDVNSELNPSVSNDENYFNDIELYEITLIGINYSLEQRTPIKETDSGVVNTSRTSNYSKIVDHRYQVQYPQSCFRYTSLTINDLVYEYGSEHKLYVRNNLCEYDDNNNTLRGRIYYRYYNNGKYYDELDSTSEYPNRINQNGIFLYTGPCFVTND